MIEVNRMRIHVQNSPFLLGSSGVEAVYETDSAARYLPGARLLQPMTFHVKPSVLDGILLPTICGSVPRDSQSGSHGDFMLRSSNAADLLHGLSLSEAFHKYVLNDPEVALLAEAVMRSNREYACVFREGQYPAPFIEFAWPLDVSDKDLAFDFVRPIMFLAGSPMPKAPIAVEKVSKVIVDRLSALRDLLTSGAVTARGTFAKTGEMRAVDRMQWRRRNLLIDVQNSDLLEMENYKPALRWSGLVLEVSAAIEVAQDIPESIKKARVSDRKHTAQRASIDAAIRAIWPDGIPQGLPVQSRDQAINKWQREQGWAVASSKTIRRHHAGN